MRQPSQYPVLVFAFIFGVVLGVTSITFTVVGNLEEELAKRESKYEQLQTEYKAKSVESYEQELVIESLNYELAQKEESVAELKKKTEELSSKIKVISSENAKIPILNKEIKNLQSEVANLKK